MANRKDVVFATAGGVDLKLDVIEPATPNGIAILFVHGGGWRVGSRDMMVPMAQEMAAFGYTGVIAQYRLNAPPRSVWPAHIHDVKAAIRWTRAEASEMGIDPARIVLWGSSAGAHLVLLAAGTPDDPRFDTDAGVRQVSTRIAAVVAVHAPTGFHVGEPAGKHTTPAAALMGDNADAESARLAGPVHHVSADFPPTLLLHGTQDRVVHHSQSQVMFDALRAARAPADLHLFSGHGHGFARIPSMRKQVAAEAAYFLDRMIVDPAKYRAEIEQYGMPAPAARSAIG